MNRYACARCGLPAEWKVYVSADGYWSLGRYLRLCADCMTPEEHRQVGPGSETNIAETTSALDRLSAADASDARRALGLGE